MLPMNSLVASTHVLIPIEPDGLSLIGLADILRMVENVRKTTNPGLEVLGIIPSRFRMVRRQSRDVIDDMERRWRLWGCCLGGLARWCGG